MLKCDLFNHDCWLKKTRRRHDMRLQQVGSQVSRYSIYIGGLVISLQWWETLSTDRCEHIQSKGLAELPGGWCKDYVKVMLFVGVFLVFDHPLVFSQNDSIDIESGLWFWDVHGTYLRGPFLPVARVTSPQIVPCRELTYPNDTKENYLQACL